MSALDDKNNIPGVLVDIENEITQEFDPSKWGKTDSVVVIGTAFSGPVSQPIKVYNSDMANYIFGASYNAATKKSATLVAGVRDAIDRGCTTVYAVRVGGEDIYKDFQFCDENNEDYRLRLVNRYPSNDAKDCYIYLDLTEGAETLTLYKPVSKATINESKSGLAGTANMVMTSVLELSGYGISKNDKLTSLITLFNDNFGNHNNVLNLQIVNKDGVVVTNEPEVQTIAIGSMYPGLYTLGRDISKCASYTNVVSNVVVDKDKDEKPFASYTGTVFKTLKFNSDVSTSYPLYADNETYHEMQEILSSVSVTSSTKWDFLENTSAVDRAWAKDKKNYEGTDMSKFEMYKALGEGFATTAMAVSRGYKADGTERKPRIIETPVTDKKNHIVGIKDGIYGILSTGEIRYRVVNCVNADDKITGTLPKADDFKIAVAKSFYMLGTNDKADDYADNLIVATANVDTDDFTAPKDYEFKFVSVDEDEVDVDNLDEILQDTVCTVLSGVDKKTTDASKAAALIRVLDGNVIKAGTKVMVFDDATHAQGQIVRYIDKKNVQVLAVAGMAGQHYVVDNVLYVGELDPSSKEVVFKPAAATQNTDNGNGTFTRADGTPGYAEFEYKDKDYLLIESAENVYVAMVDQENSTTGKVVLSPLGSLETMLTDNDDVTLIYVEDNPVGKSKVVITVGALDAMSLTDFTSLLNEDKVLGRLFTFALTNAGVKQAEMYLDELADATGVEGSIKNNVFFVVSKNVGEAHDGKVFTTPEHNKVITYDYTKYIPYTTTDNFARQLAQHCAYTSLRTKETHGIIGITPTYDLTLKAIAEHTEKALGRNYMLYAKAYDGSNMLDSDKMPHRIGSRISITAFQHDVIANDSDGYVTKANGAAAYAGMISQLPIDQSSTYQPISIPQGVDFNYTNSQNVSMIKKGYVTTVNSLNRGLTITDGVTMAESTDLTKRLMVQRIIDEVSRLIRAAGEPFLGKPNNQANRNSLNTAIDSALRSVKDTLIQSYEYTIQNLATYSADSRINISYRILPINEIREIYNNVSVIRN